VTTAVSGKVVGRASNSRASMVASSNIAGLANAAGCPRGRQSGARYGATEDVNEKKKSAASATAMRVTAAGKT